MPKLTAKQAKSVDAAESSFDPIKDGVYHARLREVTVSENPGASGFHYWKWEFEVVEEPYTNRRLWTNTSLSPAAEFKLNEMFAAFDVDSKTDTDELCGWIIRLVVGSETQQEGAGKGQIRNTISRVTTADDEFEVPEATGTVKGADGEDLF